MSASFSNQVLAQIELWKNHKEYDKQVYVLPKKLDERVAELHLKKINANLSALSEEQAAYIESRRRARLSRKLTAIDPNSARLRANGSLTV